jgi:hypothetical protein
LALKRQRLSTAALGCVIAPFMSEGETYEQATDNVRLHWNRTSLSGCRIRWGEDGL